MPRNFPEIWIGRVRQTLESGATADFLDGITEVDGDVVEMGEENVIHIPTTEFSPDILINNTTYPLLVQDYEDNTVIMKLDKYQTKPTRVTDDQIIGASYEKIDAVTKSHTNKINTTKNKKALHAIAPNSDTVKTPVLTLAGDECTYEDLVALKDKCDVLEWPEEGRRLVLCTKHYNQLLKDRKNFGDQLVNYQSGKVSPVICDFEIKKFITAPTFDSNKKKRVFGEVPQSGDKPASVVFVKDNIKKKNGLTKQYFSDAKGDTFNQASLLNYRHYFMALPVENKFIGALI